jgi:hypothetical protein
VGYHWDVQWPLRNRSTERVVAGAVAVIMGTAYCYLFPSTRRLFYSSDGWRALRDGLANWGRDVGHSPTISVIVILASSGVLYAAVRLMRR